jgi:hypothetical protein
MYYILDRVFYVRGPMETPIGEPAALLVWYQSEPGNWSSLQVCQTPVLSTVH